MIRTLVVPAVLAMSAIAVAQNTPPSADAPATGAQGGGMRSMMSPADRFKQLDKNGDGKLSMEEFSAMQMRMGGPGGGGGSPPGAAQEGTPAAGAPDTATPPANGGAMRGMMSAADRFKAMDKNNDGSISLEEFTAAQSRMGGGGGGQRPAGGT